MENSAYESKHVMELTDLHTMNTYARQQVVLERGEGSYVWDIDGKKYLDFMTGLSVHNLGHRPKAVVEAVQEQLGKIWHTTNIFYTVPGAMLASQLTSLTFADRVFFCNSGAEANEAAIKLSRRYAAASRGEACKEIISMKRSFHGRTIATLSVTGQDKVRQGFEPYLPGIRMVSFGDFEELEKSVDAKTAAIILEPIQAEGGIHLSAPGYLKKVRELCDSQGIVLIFDEVQTGMGRTGKFCAHEWEQVKPDIMSMAKALGGGLPLGACLATEKIAQTFQPGMHASTFGANPIACAAGLAMVQGIRDPALLSHCLAMGDMLYKGLQDFKKNFDFIVDIRGRGLIWGMELDFEAKDLVKEALKNQLLITLAGANTLRFLPPLNIGKALLEEGLAILEKVLSQVKKKS